MSFTEPPVVIPDADGDGVPDDADQCDGQDAAGDADGDGQQLHILGRACKIYTTVGDEWKMLYQPGTMHYPVGT